MQKRKINITLVDIHKPYDNCGTYFVETTLSDNELQKFIEDHKSNTEDYSTDTVSEAIGEHKDIEIIDGDFEDVELSF